MPDAAKDWFAGFAPIASRSGATRATRATPAEKPRNSAGGGDATRLRGKGNTRATPGNKPASVAPVAQPLPKGIVTGAMPDAAESRAFQRFVAHVAPVAHENTTGLQRKAEAALAERAVMVERDRGLPREWAEGIVWLRAMPRPANIPEPAWRRFVEDCGCFLEGGWAERAARLGWRSLELFGCHPGAPLARYDRRGLLWLIDGRQLIALTAETAVIESCTGTRLTYRRKPIHDEAVLAWDLRP